MGEENFEKYVDKHRIRNEEQELRFQKLKEPATGSLDDKRKYMNNMKSIPWEL